MVRECRPPAREPARSWLARRSTMATSTPANASSPASVSPVGPAPAITTACAIIATAAPLVSRSVRRSRATDTSTTTHAFSAYVLQVSTFGRRLCDYDPVRDAIPRCQDASWSSVSTETGRGGEHDEYV